jgi:hypothetical protein
MSNELLDSLKQQSQNLSAREKAQFAEYLLNESKSENRTNSVSENTTEDRRKRTVWLKVNREKYAGKYVALVGGELVGYGDSRPEAIRQARAAGAENPFVVFVYPKDYVGEIGVW